MSHEVRRCSAITKDGRQCEAFCKWQLDVCVAHDAATMATRRNPYQRRNRAKLAERREVVRLLLGKLPEREARLRAELAHLDHILAEP